MSAGVEVGSVDGAQTSEKSPPCNITKRKIRQNDGFHHRHIPKKETMTVTNCENRSETKTLASSSIVSEATFSSPNHIRAHQSQRKKKLKHHRKRRKKLTIDEGSRRWNYSARDFSNCEDRIVFVSYNILGVENASKHPDLYHRVPPEYLDWNYRKRTLHKEIKNYNAGIICLQEVDRFEDLQNLLREDGFRGVYKGRTGEALDGCAMFWNDELFTLLHEESIEFQRFGLRNNVSQICVFKLNEPRFASSKCFIVGNIHVLFNPGRGDIKLGQMRLFLEKAHALSQEWGNIPVVIAGDFNSMPQSAMYQFLTSSELDVQQHDRKQISGQICPQDYSGFQTKGNQATSFHASRKPFLYRWSEDELRLATGSALGDLRHPLKLCSTYVGVPGSTRTRNGFGEPLATSFHSKFMGTVDYILHTGELLPVRVLETLPNKKLRETGGLPSKQWGSDHLALVCELAFSGIGTEK